MHTTFIQTAKGLTLVALFATINARALVERQDDSVTYCQADAIYEEFWDNPDPTHQARVTTFCAATIQGQTVSTQCLSYTTPTTHVGVSVTSTQTVTRTTTVPSSTYTTTSTAMDFSLAKRAAMAEITTAPKWQAVKNILKRQSVAQPNYDGVFSSVCACHGDLSLSPVGAICTAATSTITDNGFAVTTSYNTVTSGVKTVTVVVNATSVVSTTTAATSLSSWTVSTMSGWEDWTASTSATSPSYGESTTSATWEGTSSTSATPAMSEGISSTSATPSTSEGTSPTSTSSSEESSSSEAATTATATTTTETDSTMTTTSSTITSTPTVCGGKNGTVYRKTPQECTEYEYVCGRTYDQSDFYPYTYHFSMLAACADLCDAMNFDSTPNECAGIVYNSTGAGSNCGLLKSTTSPISGDDSSIALIRRRDATCGTSTTHATTTSSGRPPWSYNDTLTSSVTTSSMNLTALPTSMITQSPTFTNTSTTYHHMPTMSTNSSYANATITSSSLFPNSTGITTTSYPNITTTTSLYPNITTTTSLYPNITTTSLYPNITTTTHSYANATTTTSFYPTSNSSCLATTTMTETSTVYGSNLTSTVTETVTVTTPWTDWTHYMNRAHRH